MIVRWSTDEGLAIWCGWRAIFYVMQHSSAAM